MQADFLEAKCEEIDVRNKKLKPLGLAVGNSLYLYIEAVEIINKIVTGQNCTTCTKWRIQNLSRQNDSYSLAVSVQLCSTRCTRAGTPDNSADIDYGHFPQEQLLS